MASLVSLTLKDHTNLCSVLAHLLVLGDVILESITLLLHSKNAETIILMQCSNALSLCSFSARPFKALLNMSPRSLSGGESFFCQIQKVWMSQPPPCWASSSLAAVYCTDGFLPNQEKKWPQPSSVIRLQCFFWGLPTTTKSGTFVAVPFSILTLNSHHSPGQYRVPVEIKKSFIIVFILHWSTLTIIFHIIPCGSHLVQGCHHFCNYQKLSSYACLSNQLSPA